MAAAGLTLAGDKVQRGNQRQEAGRRQQRVASRRRRRLRPNAICSFLITMLRVCIRASLARHWTAAPTDDVKFAPH